MNKNCLIVIPCGILKCSLIVISLCNIYGHTHLKKSNIK